MAKTKTLFRCTKCDAQFPKWEGRCRECGAWSSLVEDVIVARTPSKPAAIVDLRNVQNAKDGVRLTSGLSEFDRVLGGGLIEGSLTLLGGDPGIGKSTLLLQVAVKIAEQKNESGRTGALYVSGEESAEQVRERLTRLGDIPENFKFLGDSTVEAIRSGVDQLRPALLIVDSLQTVRSSAVTTLAKPSELKTVTEELMNIAKQTGTAVILIGHVTKGGAVAGPKTIEHLVDAVLYFEHGEGGPYRILRAVKNRFGSIAEIGVWHMTSGGLTEVSNPSGAFLGDRKTIAPGSTVGAVLEGSRVFLVEIQALVTKTRFGYPQRRAAGFDLNRLQLIIAVLSKRVGLPLAYYDVHLNVVGGLKLNEPSADLPVALAIVSALKNIPVQHDLVAIGELGLQGEVRNVPDLERRLDEAARLGFSNALTPGQASTHKKSIDAIQTPSVQEAITIALAH